MTVTIVSRIFAPEPGAAPLRLAALASALTRADEAVEVVTASVPRGMKDTYSEAGVRVRRAPVKRNRDGYVRGYVSYMSFDAPACVRLLCGRRPAGYVVEPPPTTGAVVRIVAALRRRRYVYYAADLWGDAADSIMGGVVARLLRGLERWAMNGAALVLAVSPGVAERVRGLGVHAPVDIAGFGVDAEVFRPREAAAPDVPTFVYPGMYSERHGAEVFASALGMVLDERPGAARLEFYGTGTEADRIMAACPERHRQAITFHPSVSPDRIAEIMSAATAGVASVKPGQGYDYAFATKTLALMASGCPVIYAGPGPAAEVVAQARAVHAGCAAVAFDAHAVAAAMREALDLAAQAQAQAPARRALSAWIHERHSARALADGAASRVLTALRG